MFCLSFVELGVFDASLIRKKQLFYHAVNMFYWKCADATLIINFTT